MKKKTAVVLTMVILGVIGAVFFSATRDVYIDYNSGKVRRMIKIGPAVVQDQTQETPFSLVRLKNGKNSLADAPNWQKALTMPVYSNWSPNMKGGQVYGQTVILGTYFELVNNEVAMDIKEAYLDELAKQGSVSLKTFEGFQRQILKELESELQK